MSSRVRFPALPWEFFLVGEDPQGEHGLGSKGPSWYLIFMYILLLTSIGQRSRALWASQPQKSATLSQQPGGKTTKFIRTGGGIGKKKKDCSSNNFNSSEGGSNTNSAKFRPYLTENTLHAHCEASSEVIPTRCNNCVYSSQWLYSTCFG